MDKPLTKRQQQVLEIVKDHIEESGYPPTRVDISQKLGFKSPNAAEEHLKALAKKGAIVLTPGTSRGIRLPDGIQGGIPLVGRVAAGDPILAAENIEDNVDLSPNFFHPRADYLLRVKGDSMINVGILDGDLLAVHKTNEATNGQIVVARIESEVTVKRFKRTKNPNQIFLLPENDDFSPIEVDLENQAFQIEGRSVGVIRQNL